MYLAFDLFIFTFSFLGIETISTFHGLKSLGIRGVFQASFRETACGAKKLEKGHAKAKAMK